MRAILAALVGLTIAGQAVAQSDDDWFIISAGACYRLDNISKLDLTPTANGSGFKTPDEVRSFHKILGFDVAPNPKNSDKLASYTFVKGKDSVFMNMMKGKDLCDYMLALVGKTQQPERTAVRAPVSREILNMPIPLTTETPKLAAAPKSIDIPIPKDEPRAPLAPSHEPVRPLVSPPTTPRPSDPPPAPPEIVKPQGREERLPLPPVPPSQIASLPDPTKAVDDDRWDVPVVAEPVKRTWQKSYRKSYRKRAWRKRVQSLITEQESSDGPLTPIARGTEIPWQRVQPWEPTFRIDLPPPR